MEREPLTLDGLNMVLTCSSRVDLRPAGAGSETRKGIYLTAYRGLSFKTYFIGYAVDQNAVIIERVG